MTNDLAKALRIVQWRSVINNGELDNSHDLMKKLFSIVLIALTLLCFDNTGQEPKVLNGIVTDGHRNGQIAITAIVKGTTTGAVTDVCGRFSIPFPTDELTLLFHGMSYDDSRTYEIRLKKSGLTNDTIVFQLGHWKVKNANCRKVNRRLKRYVIE